MLSLAGIAVTLAIFYLSVRWGLAIAAILAEGIGLRDGLRRSSELTRGHRLRLAGIVLVVGILEALTVTLPSVVFGLVIGTSVNAASPGIVSFTLASIVGSAIWAPFMPAVSVVAYELLTERASRARSRRGRDPPARLTRLPERGRNSSIRPDPNGPDDPWPGTGAYHHAARMDTAAPVGDPQTPTHRRLACSPGAASCAGRC